MPWLPRGRALDLACGLGDSAITLARLGWRVTAIDISEVAMRHAARRAQESEVHIEWIVADLNLFPLPTRSFNLILNFHYLQRSHLPEQISDALCRGGALLYETFSHEQLALPNSHIRNRAHVLEPGELLRMFPRLHTRAYRELVSSDRAIASLAAERRTHPTA